MQVRNTGYVHTQFQLNLGGDCTPNVTNVFVHAAPARRGSVKSFEVEKPFLLPVCMRFILRVCKKLGLSGHFLHALNADCRISLVRVFC